MSEEIIKDGVNVAECENFIENTTPNADGDEFLNVCDNPNTESSYCENNKNCYYKQLKRLQAENEQLKAELKSQQMINLKQQDIAQDYWNALEEIREMCELYIDDKADLTPEQVIDIISEVLK